MSRLSCVTTSPIRHVKVVSSQEHLHSLGSSFSGCTSQLLDDSLSLTEPLCLDFLISGLPYEHYSSSEFRGGSAFFDSLSCQPFFPSCEDNFDNHTLYGVDSSCACLDAFSEF